MVASKLWKLKIVPPNRRQFFCIPQFSKKKSKIEKTYLEENPDLNVMRNRTIAEHISAPPTFGMESIDFRKFGRRNLGARWGATTARAPAGLENYRPQLCNPCTFHWCRGGFRIPWEPKKCTQPDKTRLTKTTAALGDAKPACANRLGGVPDKQ